MFNFFASRVRERLEIPELFLIIDFVFRVAEFCARNVMFAGTKQG